VGEDAPPSTFDLGVQKKRTFACTLEELYTGCTKKMKITKTLVESGKRMQAEKILTLQVKPGWKTGTKVTFPEEIDEAPCVVLLM